MSTNRVEPSMDLVSFSCPHCGALAHQTWHDTYAVPLEGTPFRLDAGSIQGYLNDPKVSLARKHEMIEYSRRVTSGEVFLDPSKEDHYSKPTIRNLFISHCFSCKAEAVWIDKRIVYPRTQTSTYVPNLDLNKE